MGVLLIWLNSSKYLEKHDLFIIAARAEPIASGIDSGDRAKLSRNLHFQFQSTVPT